MSFSFNIDGGNDIAPERVAEYEAALRDCVTAVLEPYGAHVARADWQIAYICRRDALTGIEQHEVAYRLIVTGGVHDGVDAPEAERIEYELLAAIHWLASSMAPDTVTGQGAQFHYAGSHALNDADALAATAQAVASYHAAVADTAAAPACTATLEDPNADHVHTCGLPQHEVDTAHACSNDDCTISWLDPE